MYTIEKFKELFTGNNSQFTCKQFEANHIGDTNTFLDAALVAPDLYVCFENVYKAINNVKDVTDPVCKIKFNKIKDVLLLLNAINKGKNSEQELQRLLDNAISCFENLTKGTEVIIQPEVLYQIGSTSFKTKEAMNEYLLRRVGKDLEHLKTNANSSDKEIIIEMIKDINLLKQ